MCARRSWRDPAGGSPVREGGSARPVASVAGSTATMVLKRTQRDDEDCIELRKLLTVEAEALRTAAGNMRGTVMRGTVAPPESETSSSRQGSCRNLGGLLSPAAALAVPGRIGKLERATPVRKTGEVGRPHSVCLTADASGGLKSHSARDPGLISEGGGNASPARRDGRYGEASEARRRKPGHG